MLLHHLFGTGQNERDPGAKISIGCRENSRREPAYRIGDE
jgi:hypothetical protein